MKIDTEDENLLRFQPDLIQKKNLLTLFTH